MMSPGDGSAFVFALLSLANAMPVTLVCASFVCAKCIPSQSLCSGCYQVAPSFHSIQVAAHMELNPRGQPAPHFSMGRITT